MGVVSWIDSSHLHGASRRSARLACAIAIAYASHTLLDWLGTDSSPPIGIMALWPFSRGYYESTWHVFMAISRRYWLPEFWTFNLYALGARAADPRADRRWSVLGPCADRPRPSAA